NLIAPASLLSSNSAAAFLASHIDKKNKIIIIGDYDADGATASACGVLGLKKFGADVSFIVPNRFKFGYGLTPEIVEIAAEQKPELIITVDNGIASIEGVTKAREKGIDVLITDHHLPADILPNANFIINPNQPNCKFPSKNLCGVGVIFYLLLSLRAYYRNEGKFFELSEPQFSDLLELVCLGTVADLVPLDFNNRILVDAGIKKMRSGMGNYGIRAIAKLSKKNISEIKTSDLSFSIAPKLNAAGRLADMSLGIKCLISETQDEALLYAKQLISLNDERKSIEVEMLETALALVNISSEINCSITLFNANWHQGVIGIIASRLKEEYYRPTIIFAKDDSGLLKGSGRSISSFHLRDALDLVSKEYPEIIVTFGGHAMAAGLTIREKDFNSFSEIFERTAKKLLSEDDLNLTVEVDNSILDSELDYQTVNLINKEIWGQSFPPPLFSDEFNVISQRTIAEKHTKLYLSKGEINYDAIFFNNDQTQPDRIRAIYSIEVNDFNGIKSIQIIIKSILNE
ncbi:single-stranded-DNA-specific exonuclease RecJ, partial [Methylophilaceae bacterium]|nr:single-stranded-DNA-specific exonuclease RecJ [Methylophilaceae bacterium]